MALLNPFSALHGVTANNDTICSFLQLASGWHQAATKVLVLLVSLLHLHHSGGCGQTAMSPYHTLYLSFLVKQQVLV